MKYRKQKILEKIIIMEKKKNILRVMKKKQMKELKKDIKELKQY